MQKTVIIFFTYIKKSTLNLRIVIDTRAKNWKHEQNSCKTKPGTGRKSESVLEPEPELPDNLGQF